MGLTLQGAGAFAGSATEGYLDKREDNREQRTSDQEQEQYDLEMKARIAQVMKGVFVEREGVDADIAPITAAPQGGIPTQEGPPAPGPQAAPAPGGGAPALPTQEGPPAPGPQAAPAPAPAPRPSRRERHTLWNKEARDAVMMAGGMEAVKVFDDTENALSRKQMSGYGMTGVKYMQSGDAGAAVKQFNTMLEVSPQDLGMEFQAYDGKVYLLGSDGKRNKPFNQAAMEELIRGRLFTPEDYLAMQQEAREATEDEGAARTGEALDTRKQDEVEGAARTGEALDTRKQTEVEGAARTGEALDTRKQTEVERGALSTEAETRDHHLMDETIDQQKVDIMVREIEVLEQKLPSHIAKEGAEIYKMLKDAQSNEIRAIAAAKADQLGWTPALRLKIQEMIPTQMQNTKTNVGYEWIGPMAKNAGMGTLMQSGMMDIMLENPEQGGPNIADAIHIGGLAYAGLASVQLPEGTVLPRVKQEGNQWFVDFNGKKIAVPEHIARGLQITKKVASGAATE